jgi:hypothetical protein
MSRNNIKKVPYCKVCHDAGKPENEYKSHWVKDFNGKTLCPVLLNTECRYCFKLGHTAKFCNVLEKNKKEKESGERRAEPKQQPEKKKIINGFAALHEDSDVEEEQEIQIIDSSKNIEKTEIKTGWAAIVAKPKAEQKQVITIPTVKIEVSKPTNTKNWADWSESEDDDDDEEVDYYQNDDDYDW